MNENVSSKLVALKASSDSLTTNVQSAKDIFSCTLQTRKDLLTQIAKGDIKNFKLQGQLHLPQHDIIIKVCVERDQHIPGYILMKGGWLPLGFESSMRGMVYIIDSNIAISFEHNKIEGNFSPYNVLDLTCVSIEQMLATNNIHIEPWITSLNMTKGAIAFSYPKGGIPSNIKDIENFITAAHPLLVEYTKINGVASKTIQAKICDYAQRHKVSQLVALLAISCRLDRPAHLSPGRLILKPEKLRQNPKNAALDIFLFEYALGKLVESPNTALITGDKGLALAWAKIQEYSIFYDYSIDIRWPIESVKVKKWLDVKIQSFR